MRTSSRTGPSRANGARRAGQLRATWRNGSRRIPTAISSRSRTAVHERRGGHGRSRLHDVRVSRRRSGELPYERYRWYFVPQFRTRTRTAGLISSASARRSDVTRTSTTAVRRRDRGRPRRGAVPPGRRRRACSRTTGTRSGSGTDRNAYLYFAPLEGRVEAASVGHGPHVRERDAKLFPEGSEAQITRLIQRPQFRRMYLRILDGLLETAWNPGTSPPTSPRRSPSWEATGRGILDSSPRGARAWSRRCPHPRPSGSRTWEAPPCPPTGTAST